MATGRFAPSPTGVLHLGNLRTALLAWLFARSSGSPFLLRFEDLDDSARPEHADGQVRDMQALGLDWDGEPLWQSTRLDRYRQVIAGLEADGRTYPCWCSRRDIREAPSAPHGPPGSYPGTCRDLSSVERDRRADETGRPPALRLRAEGAEVTVVDRLHGEHTEVVDDLVLRRFDGTPAYHLTVVVDDDDTGVEEVVRADDLLPSTPRHVFLAGVLGIEPPAYAHVPLVLGPDGERLAKRHGAVTLGEQLALGHPVSAIVSQFATSLQLAEPGETVTVADLVDRFDPSALPRDPWVLPLDDDP